MAFDLREALDENARTISLGVILFVVLVSAIILFTYIDITVHDFYTLPWGSMCYTGNTNPDCVNVQTLLNCPTGGDTCIEAKYYQMLQVEALYLAGLLVFLKVAISQGVLRFQLNWTRAYQTFVWGASALVLLWAGWEDFLYYAIRGMGIPNMPWLNNVGLFPYITQYVTHDNVVGPLDLFILMMGGLIGVMLMWYFYIKVTDEEYEIPI